MFELYNISEALVDVLREAYGLANAGEFGEPLREILRHARELVALANETLAADRQAGEHARGTAMRMAEQLVALEALFGPIEWPESQVS